MSKFENALQPRGSLDEALSQFYGGRSEVEDVYYRLLSEFVSTCNELVRDGFAYAAVLLGHELFRYLYPTEPYANFKHQDPLNFSVQHIANLLGLAKTLRSTVSPYSFSLDARSQDANDMLEKATSDLYSTLWQEFDQQTLTRESLKLLTARIPETLVGQYIRGKTVLDMGCGSGRYSVALAACGARQVTAVDFQAKAYREAEAYGRKKGLPLRFLEANVHALPFSDGEFDFVFCNGVLHHSSSIEKGIAELKRVLKPEGAAFLYLYGAEGFFWHTRNALRRVFCNIPLNYTRMILKGIGMPSNRFIFCDTWYVPTETHTSAEQMIKMLDDAGFRHEKLISNQPFDLDRALSEDPVNGPAMWGCGEHRYFLWKPARNSAMPA